MESESSRVSAESMSTGTSVEDGRADWSRTFPDYRDRPTFLAYHEPANSAMPNAAGILRGVFGVDFDIVVRQIAGPEPAATFAEPHVKVDRRLARIREAF